MRVRTWDNRLWVPDWVMTNDIQIPNTPGTYTRTLNYICGMSDRCYSYSPDNPNAWAYNVSMSVDATFTVSVNTANNTINVSFSSWSNWKCVRYAGPTPAGLPVVRGNYTWFSTVNGATIHNYIGPTTSGQGNASWSGSGGTTTFSTGNIAPQQESSRQQFGRIHNNVNGVESYAYISFFNDLPPDYRPGERKVSGTWRSHNRDGGVCERKNGSWDTMRTVGGDAGATGDPPERKISGSWKNQSKIGAE